MSFVTCPHHPDKRILAYQQTAFSTPCTIELDHGSMEIELDDRAEFERDMETTVIVCYLCSDENCDWSILPEQLRYYASEAPDPELVHTAQVVDAASGTLKGIDHSITTTWPEEPNDPAVDVAAAVGANEDIEPVKQEGETDSEFNSRRADFQARRREAMNPHDYVYESPIAKLGRVFGGP